MSEYAIVIEQVERYVVHVNDSGCKKEAAEIALKKLLDASTTEKESFYSSHDTKIHVNEV